MKQPPMFLYREEVTRDGASDTVRTTTSPDTFEEWRQYWYLNRRPGVDVRFYVGQVKWAEEPIACG